MHLSGPLIKKNYIFSRSLPPPILGYKGGYGSLV